MACLLVYKAFLEFAFSLKNELKIAKLRIADDFVLFLILLE